VKAPSSQILSHERYTAEIFISIGSNLGHRFDNIRKALRLIAKDAVKEMRVSVVFETEAILPPLAPRSWNLPYLNLVLAGTSSLSPRSLLTTLKNFEKELGRDLNAPRGAPRIIDLDILTWDDRVISEDGLKLPHPELMNRPFLVNLMASLQPSYPYPFAEILHRHIKFNKGTSKCFLPFPQLVGIVNITPDSFSDGGKYFHAEKAIQRVQELTDHGAAIIDIGAQSTRPGALPISTEEEWSRLKPVLELVAQNLSERPAKPLISLDSYDREVIRRVLECYPIDWINDVNGGKDERLLEIVAKTSCKIVLNHSLTVPPSVESVLPFDRNPISYLKCWAEEKIDQLDQFGIPKERVILDPGIGFGKTPFQSISLLREIDVLKKTGCEILVGHSRKSFLKILPDAENRDLETIGISHFLLGKGVDYLRVHNIEAHQKSLTAFALLGGLDDF
jgi:2-amino-4-hydroxy-6-hydroxymethyldihydropteridine diphosphokinase/dihydropteroate synthase